MSLIGAQLKDVWDALRASKPQHKFSLEEIRVKNFRGIKDLRVVLQSPVSVLAGANGCGKTTVLLAAACAYQPAGSASTTLTPAKLFPAFTDRLRGVLSDDIGDAAFAYYYVDDGQRLSMMWRRRKTWNRSFMGHRGAKQPTRQVYLRTSANLTSPSEVRGVLQLVRKNYLSATITPRMLSFSDRILPQRYQQVSIISAEGRDILFAEVKNNDEARYSEFHMSAGERTILRISKDIANLEDALVLIDEVESGLHPYTQQQLMLELQRLALRQRLQIIVASHSPVVLDSVPPEARLFLDRDEQTLDVQILPPHRDIFQKALYGQSREQLSILCEDEVAEATLLGILDVLQPRLQLRPEDFLIGRDTGRDEFPAHIRALGKFRSLSSFIFVLDGDARDREEKLRGIAERYGHDFRPLFLPGDGPPEQWIWKALGGRPTEYENHLGMSSGDIEGQMRVIEQMMEGSLAKESPAKQMVDALARELNRSVADLARVVGRQEAESGGYEVADLVRGLEERIGLWRKLQ